MNRRQTLFALATLPALAHAHHGWSSFDQSRPVYLAGKVKSVKWVNPHAEIDLEIAPKLAVPPDLANRPVPAQVAQVDGKMLLAKATVPNRKDKVWHVELAPLSRMEAWKIDKLAVGESIELIGFTFPGEKGEAILRADYLFKGEKAYGLRSGPAA